MNLQKIILKKYLEKNKNPTINFISKDTGIQSTRVFRILNGYEMRIGEYEIFLKKTGEQLDGDSLFKTCLNSLEAKNIFEIESFMQRKLRMNKLQQAEYLKESNVS